MPFSADCRHQSRASKGERLASEGHLVGEILLSVFKGFRTSLIVPALLLVGFMNASSRVDFLSGMLYSV